MSAGAGYLSSMDVGTNELAPSPLGLFGGAYSPLPSFDDAYSAASCEEDNLPCCTAGDAEPGQGGMTAGLQSWEAGRISPGRDEIVTHPPGTPSESPLKLSDDDENHFHSCPLGAAAGGGEEQENVDHEQEGAEIAGASCARSEPSAPCENIDLDTMIVDDKSWRAPQLQRWIFKELGEFCAATRTGVEYGGGLEVLPAVPFYNENVARMLKTSDPAELRRKAYIVQSRSGMSTQLHDGACIPEPQGAKSINILPSCGDEHAKLGYLPCTWRTFIENERGTLEHRKRKPTTDDDERAEDDKPTVRVYAFFWLSGDVLQEVLALQELKKKEKKTSKLKLEHLGPSLYIVLPADRTPVTLRHALCTFLDKGLVERLRKQAPGNSDFHQLAQMLSNLHESDWADWVWDEEYIKPRLAVLNQFAYKHGHMAGIQSAAEIEKGNFNAPEHFKAMLMYQEMFLQYLTEHESRIELIADRVSNLNTTACTVAAQGSSLR